MKQIGLLIALLVCGCTALHDNAAKPQQANGAPGLHYVPLGLLGYPLGTFLTIEGAAGQTKGGIRVRVETVNGKPCDSDVTIHVNDIYVTNNVRCKIKGYETGGMVGIPPAIKELDPNKNYKVQQSQWQFWHYFEPISIDYPEELSKQLEASKNSQSGRGE